jgi:hypothetical protein
MNNSSFQKKRFVYLATQLLKEIELPDKLGFATGCDLVTTTAKNRNRKAIIFCLFLKQLNFLEISK